MRAMNEVLRRQVPSRTSLSWLNRSGASKLDGATLMHGAMAMNLAAAAAIKRDRSRIAQLGPFRPVLPGEWRYRQMGVARRLPVPASGIVKLGHICPREHQ